MDYSGGHNNLYSDILESETMKGLIDKERNSIEEQRQDLIDRAAAEGKTIPLESIFAKLENEPEPAKQEAEKMKKELREKYGEDIPIDTAYKLMKQWDPDA